MKVYFQCGYYSDLAHKYIAKRPEPYWDANFYTWGVKVGSFKKSFYIWDDGIKRHINAKNFGEVRAFFGRMIEACVKRGGIPKDAIFVPVPSKDGLKSEKRYRSAEMLREALDSTKLKNEMSTGLRWSKKLTSAHTGGSRSRKVLASLLVANPALKGKSVVLVDDLITTGASLLAAQDCLEAVGAKVLCAIVVGRTIYDLDTPNFGLEEFELKTELHDFDKAKVKAAEKAKA